MTTQKLILWLVLKRGFKGRISVRKTSKTKPTIFVGERTLRLAITVPDELFFVSDASITIAPPSRPTVEGQLVNPQS